MIPQKSHIDNRKTPRYKDWSRKVFEVDALMERTFIDTLTWLKDIHEEFKEDRRDHEWLREKLENQNIMECGAGRVETKSLLSVRKNM